MIENIYSKNRLFELIIHGLGIKEQACKDNPPR